MSVTQVPATTATTTLTLLYFTKLESDDVLAAFLCLALAHRSRLNGGRAPNDNPGILGFDEVEHGNNERRDVERRANEWRNRRVALMKLYTLGPKAFQRRFKLNRP